MHGHGLGCCDPCSLDVEKVMTRANWSRDQNNFTMQGEEAEEAKASSQKRRERMCECSALSCDREIRLGLKLAFK